MRAHREPVNIFKMTLQRARGTLALTAIMITVALIELAACSVSQNAEATLIRLGAIVPGTIRSGELWRLIAAIFLHAGVLHLVFNLWAFVQIGYGWETLFGTGRFLVAFFGSGLIASIASAIYVEPPGAVGASGAIFGLFSSFIVLLLRRPEWRTAAWTRRLSWQLALWSVITLVLGFVSPRIDNAAHLGGVIGGVAIGFFLTRRARNVLPTGPST